MPLYNSQDFLSHALESLLAQTHVDFELVISDNASTDATGMICEEYREKDHRIKYFRNKHNLGSTANFNQVLKLSTGEYFMWAAGDDVWEPTYIETMLFLLKSNPSAALAFSVYDNANENFEQTRTYPYLFELPDEDLYKRLKKYINQEESLGKANPIYGLMKRNLILEAGGLRKIVKTGWGLDMLVVFQLLNFGNLVISPELLFHKRQIYNPSNNNHFFKKTTFLRKILGYLYSYNYRLVNLNYILGYLKIVNNNNKLSKTEKIHLIIIIFYRAFKILIPQTVINALNFYKLVNFKHYLSK